MSATPAEIALLFPKRSHLLQFQKRMGKVQGPMQKNNDLMMTPCKSPGIWERAKSGSSGVNSYNDHC